MFRFIVALLAFLCALPRRRAPRMILAAVVALTILFGGLAVKPSDASANTAQFNASACNYAASYCYLEFTSLNSGNQIPVRFDFYSASCACYAYDYVYVWPNAGTSRYLAAHYIYGDESSVYITVYAPGYTQVYDHVIYVRW